MPSNTNLTARENPNGAKDGGRESETSTYEAEGVRVR